MHTATAAPAAAAAFDLLCN